MVRSKNRIITIFSIFLIVVLVLGVLPGTTYAKFQKGTAEVNIHWVPGNSSTNFLFTYNNPANSEPALCITIDRPNAHFTIVGGSASGWTVSNTATQAKFIGNSIPVGASATFVVATDADASSSAQSSWAIKGSKNSSCAPPASANPVFSGALDTGIDIAAPTGYEITNITADSSSQLTISSFTATDSESGLYITPYNFEETSGNAGGSDSGWIASNSFIDSGLLPNTSYSYHLQARDAVLNESVFSAVSSKYTLASIPSGGIFSGVTQTEITTSWSANGNPSGTEYFVENQTVGTNSGWQTESSWDSAGLSAETGYSFRVKARNADGVETTWYDLGTSSTLAEDEEPEPEEEVIDPEIPEVVPEPVGPEPVVPEVEPREEEAEIGEEGTTTAELSVIGGTWSAVPIEATPGDVWAPRIEVTSSPEEIIKGGQFSLEAVATDDQGEIFGVIEYLAYSLDGGISWHPVSKVIGIGEKRATFQIDSFPLLDGDYEILLKSSDNSENQIIFDPILITIDQEDPQIVSLSARVGNLDIASKSFGDITVSENLQFEILAAFTGGPTEASLVIGDQAFDFKPSALKNYWIASINLESTGDFSGEVHAKDGAGNILEENIFKFVVIESLRINTQNDEEIIIYQFNSRLSNWQEFNGGTYNLQNPTKMSDLNNKGLILPTGKYYLKKLGSLWPYRFPIFSNVIKLSEISSLSGQINNIVNSQAVSAELSSFEEIDSSLDGIETYSGQNFESLRGKDILIYNFNPRNFTSLEQLSIYDQYLKKRPDRVEVVALTPEIYKDQVLSMANRGKMEVDFIFDKGMVMQRELFKYKDLATLFVSRRGEVEKIKSGYITRDEIVEILNK